MSYKVTTPFRDSNLRQYYDGDVISQEEYNALSGPEQFHFEAAPGEVVEEYKAPEYALGDATPPKITYSPSEDKDSVFNEALPLGTEDHAIANAHDDLDETVSNREINDVSNDKSTEEGQGPLAD